MDRPEELEMKYMIFGGVLIILLLSVSVIFFFIVYQKKLLEQQVRLQKIQNDYQHQLLSSSIQAEEQERSRIGHDLHDGIGSALSTIKLLMGQVQYHDPESRHIITHAGEILTNTIQEVRNISYSLYPAVLSKFGLAEAIQHLVITVSEVFGVQVQYEPGEIDALGYVKELALYRITQELVNNVLKHAKAKRLLIELDEKNRQVRLSVRDDGCGFDYLAVMKSLQTGTGLKGIEARVAMLMADLQVDTEIGKGTHVTVQLPVSSL